VKTGSKGLAIIKEFEGLRLEAYRCAAGVWTIGYGHTAAAGPPTVVPGMVMTRAQAEAALIRDLVQYERAVASAVKVPLTQDQFDACVSLCYNIGIGAFRGSTVVRRINAGRMAEVPSAFMMWTKGGGRELPGLVRRRRAEAALWRSLADGNATAGRADVAQVEEVGAEVPATQSKPVLTAGALAGVGGVLVPAAAGVANLWQFAGLGLVMVAIGIGVWLVMSGRISISGAE
jgi:lysozyme